MIRSALAVVAGIAVLTATSFAIEAVANPVMLKIFHDALPNEAALRQNALARLFLFFYTSLCVAGGGYVTAWLARRWPAGHAAMMGAVQLALTVWAMFSLREQAPLLNWMVSLVLVVPVAWCGGLLRARRMVQE
ncbi:MAG: hypothetical protein LAP40_07730 [Acidobacteriia bacterium]|nr:hypothetical protein [Terriglobia bacterium]